MALKYLSFGKIFPSRENKEMGYGPKIKLVHNVKETFVPPPSLITSCNLVPTRYNLEFLLMLTCSSHLRRPLRHLEAGKIHRVTVKHNISSF
jgi:hypothetical protein